jgi:hypothetical protein
MEQGSEIGLSVTQDGKLLLLGDDKGNDPVTWDLQFQMSLKGEQQKFGYWVAGVKGEYASLVYKDFMRYGFFAGHTFTNLPIPFTEKAKWTLGFTIGEGWMQRNDDGWMWSAEFGMEVSIPVWEWLNIIPMRVVLTQRQDLKPYGDEWKRYNLSAGIEIDINTKY